MTTSQQVITESAATSKPSVGGMRTFVQGDIPQVSDLVWKVLHQKQGASPAGLKAYFKELFLENPWQEDGIVSRVVEDKEGKIVAFFGTIARRMTFKGKTLRFAFGSNFVVDPTSRSSMAAIQLVRAMMKGPQDVSITDSANENSRQMLRSLGFSIVPIYSLLWARPLRPASYVLHAVARLKKSKLVRTLSTLAKPVSALADATVVHMPLSPFRQTKPETVGEDLDLDTHLQALSRLPKNWLVPEYDRASLKWVVDFVVRNKSLGEEVRKVAVRDKSGKLLGWYLYYVDRDEAAEVLQVGAETGCAQKVLDHLFYDAWSRGLIGLHGRLEPQFMEDLTLRSCFFLRNGSWTLAHSNKPELMALVHSGNAFFSRIDGEWGLRPPRMLNAAQLL